LSQRRDLTDPDVIRRFGERIGMGDERALGELYLLTRCDTAMTSPGNLSAWKDQLLGELYTRTRDLFCGAAADEGAARAATPVRQRVRELLATAGGPAVDLVDRLDDRTVLALTPRQIARHLLLVGRRRAAGAPVDIEVTPYPLKGHTEVAVVADDSLGLLSHIAGVLAAHRVSI